MTLIAYERKIPLANKSDRNKIGAIQEVQKQSQILQQEQVKTEYADRYILYLGAKWHVINDSIERAIYCPTHEAKMYSKYWNFAYTSRCPIESCLWETNYRVEDVYERAVSAIPIMIREEEKKLKEQKQSNKSSVAGMKYVQHEGVLWEYDPVREKLNDAPLCPKDKTTLLRETSPRSMASMVFSNLHYCPKCKARYFEKISIFDWGQLIKEVNEIVRGELRQK